MLDALAPTAMVSALFGAGSARIANSTRRKYKKYLADPEKYFNDENTHDDFLNMVYDISNQLETMPIKDVESGELVKGNNKELSNMWLNIVNSSLNENKPIVINDAIEKLGALKAANDKAAVNENVKNDTVNEAKTLFDEMGITFRSEDYSPEEVDRFFNQLYNIKAEQVEPVVLTRPLQTEHLPTPMLPFEEQIKRMFPDDGL